MIELADALDVGLVELHRNAEGQRREDGNLVRGVHALDVECRVGLGIAQALRLLEHDIEGHALVAHFGEDEVGGAVDDAGDPLNAVGGEAFAHGLDDRNAARHRRLEGDHDALLVRGGEDLVAMHRQQCLVGRHHVLAVGDGLQHQFLGNAATADQFDDDVDLGVGYHRESVVGHLRPAGRDLPRHFQIFVRDPGDADRPPGAPGDFGLVAGQYVEGATTDGADAEQSCIDGFHFRFFLKQKDGITMPSRK